MIRFIIGLLLTFGAVGGMEDPAKEAYFLEQCLAALVGLAVMFWGTAKLVDNDRRSKYN
jgi:hypothetical protein